MNSKLFWPASARSQRARGTFAFGCLLWALGLAVMVTLASPSHFSCAYGASNLEVIGNLMSPTSSTSATLMGTVYVDVNEAGKLTTGDLAVKGALIQLFSKTDLTNPFAETITNSLGQYQFNNIPKGTYTIKNASPSPSSNKVNKGLIYNANLNDFVITGLGTEDNQDAEISDIQLDAGYQAMNYNFGNDQFPLQLYSKRYLIAGGDNYIQPVKPVPEPAFYINLLAAIGAAGGWAWWRRRKAS